jgi:hypothetical protein
MTIPILCVVGVLLVGWIVILKAEVDDLRKEIGRLKNAVERVAASAGMDGTIDIAKGSSSWGKKSSAAR